MKMINAKEKKATEMEELSKVTEGLFPAYVSKTSTGKTRVRVEKFKVLKKFSYIHFFLRWNVSSLKF